MLPAYVDHIRCVGLVRELRRQYWANGYSDCKSHISLQTALSYYAGYCSTSSLEESVVWLERSGRLMRDMEFQVNYAKTLIIPQCRRSQICRLHYYSVFTVDDARVEDGSWSQTVEGDRRMSRGSERHWTLL